MTRYIVMTQEDIKDLQQGQEVKLRLSNGDVIHFILDSEFENVIKTRRDEGELVV